MDDLCVRCGDCMEICPEAVIVCGVGGLPQLDLGRGSCNRCGLCADVCMRGAIDPLGAILLKSA
ncbi:MAG: 4Fe-4S binding protein [Pseudomonadota bacterium]